MRGGPEGGRRWWLDGRLTAKQHTFDDHIAVADGLAAAGLVDPDRIATRGLSAGGLLQGAVFSQRPDRWCAVVAEVPFVDVVTTMLDDSIPLTVTEWDEWGDPQVREHFDAMLAYSPYDNPPKPGSRPGPARHRRRPRHAGAGARARQVGRPAARDRPGVVARWAACSASSSAPARTSGRAAASTTSLRGRGGRALAASTGWASAPDRWLRTATVAATHRALTAATSVSVRAGSSARTA